MSSNSEDLVGRLRNPNYAKSSTFAASYMQEAAEMIEQLTQEAADLETLKNVYKQDCLASESKLREIEAETREACAKIAESEFKSRPWHAVMRQAGNTIAAAIRSQASQGEKK